MASLKVPIVTVIAGEGGSGGALGIAMGNVVGMLSSAYYGVISPEGAASILGRYKNDADKAKRFPDDCRALATMQKIYAPQLQELGVVDEVLYDSSAEVHDNFPTLAGTIENFVRKSLSSLSKSSTDDLIQQRYNKFRTMGQFDLLNSEERAARVATARTVPQPVRPNRKAGDAVANAPSRVLKYLSERTISGPYSSLKGKAPAALSSYVPSLATTPVRPESSRPTRDNAKSILDRDGPEALASWVRQTSPTRTLITDTTLRDAHQSLLATRMRTVDLLAGCPEASHVLHDAFSFECWGGATFDVSYRFLSEDPWERLRQIRKACPNVCLQMLIRGSNAVGYTSYPDNVIVEFVNKAAETGMDVFRIFDCFNDLKQMKVCIDAVRAVKKVAEVCICFTGDFLKPDKEKIYTLKYFQDLAREIDAAGAHIIAIKDMAGLLKPGHARPLVAAIREVSNKPIHFHTHSTSGVSLPSALAMVDAGCDIVDVAIAGMSEATSQPNMNALVASLEGHTRDTGIDYLDLEILDNYWKNTRAMYAPFENGVQSSSARVFDHQIPGGQYSNLMVQCKSMGLWPRWNDVLDMYRDVNHLFGDVVKVTPSSKCVGDLALYLINRKMKVEDVISRGDEIEFPQSTLDLCAGRLGFPHRGLPKELQRVVLKGEVPMTVRPGELMPPADFNVKKVVLEEKLGRAPTMEEILSSSLYPKVYDDYLKFLDENGPVTILPTIPFWYGMSVNDTVDVVCPTRKDYDELMGSSNDGDRLEATIRLKRVSALKRGARTLTFDVNGVRRCVVMDDAEDGGASSTVMADPNDPTQLPSPLPGTVEEINVEAGMKLEKGDCIMVIVAMKMEVKVTAPFDLKIDSLTVEKGDKVEEGSLVAKVTKL
jgi:pyruvate carboxylase